MARVLDKQYRPDIGTPIPKMNAADIFPQLQNEPDAVYGVRRTLNQGVGGLANMGIDLFNALGSTVDTPAARAKRAPKPQTTDGFPVQYTDSAYDMADANASKLTGVPQDLLRSLRVNGERSNAGQVSSAGARTPYQITPETRAGIMKNYGIDPWSSATNASLGAAYVAWEQAGRPRPQEWDEQRKMKAVGGYFGGAAGAANPFGGLSDGNTTVGQYTQRVLNPDTKLSGPFLNPYNPAADAAAMGELERARAGMMTPSHFSVAGAGPPPAMPKPEAIPTTDFSKSNASLQAMKPVAMTAKEQLTRERDGWFKGIGQAMMNMSGNEGIGTFLMKLGGASLAGREGARDEIRREQDKFDEKMSQFHAAVFSNDLQQAKIHASEAQAQVQQNNDYAMNNWKVGYDRWKGAGGSVDISGTNAVVTRKDVNGNITADVLPIAGAVDAMIARERAQLFQSVGGRQFAGNQQITGMQNAIIGRAAIQAMQGGAGAGSEADGAAVAAPAAYATFVATHGGVVDVLGPEGAKSLEQSIQKQLMSQQIVPGSKDWIDKHDTIVATELTKLGIASPDMMKKLMQAGGAMSSFQALEDVNSRRTSQRTDAKGMTTSTTTSRASDVFSSDQFNEDLAAHNYVRR